MHGWAQQAGSHSQLEQEVVTNYGPVEASAVPMLGVTKRADIVFLLPGGERHIVDVAVTHTLMGETVLLTSTQWITARGMRMD